MLGFPKKAIDLTVPTRGLNIVQLLDIMSESTMRSRRIKIGIVLVVVTSLLILVSYALGGLNSLNRPSPENSPVTLRAETDKTSYTPGESVKIEIYLINHKNLTMKLFSITIQCDVFNSQGESIRGFGSCYTYGQEYPIILPPLSETLFEGIIEWDQKSLSGNGSGYSLTEVNPGIYTIRVTVVSSFGTTVSEAVVEIKG